MTDATAQSWHDLGPVERFAEGKPHGGRVGNVQLCFGRSGDRWFAIDDTCPHAGGSLAEGMLDDDLAICPLHAYAFEIDTGRCLDDPACSVSAYPVRVRQGILQVRI
jgi:nitrite reductase/ring-hydroxylating ferredoxin subunit